MAKKGRAMAAGDFTPAFAVDGGLKDTRLIAAAATAAGIDVPLTDATGVLLQALSESGHGAEDIAVLGRAAGGAAS